MAALWPADSTSWKAETFLFVACYFEHHIKMGLKTQGLTGQLILNLFSELKYDLDPPTKQQWQDRQQQNYFGVGPFSA